MLIVIRTGSGLGNQLFQYVAGLYFADKYDAELKIAIDPNKSPESRGYPRPFHLTKFAVKTKAEVPSSFDQILQANNSKIDPLARLACTFTGAVRVMEPKAYQFMPELPIKPGARTVHVRGYWQSARYAEGVESKVREELVLREPPTEATRRVQAQIENSKCPVSLHVRRGDYLLAKQGNLALPLSYYREAIAMFCEKFDDPEFFVFSDDIEFAKQNLPEGIRAQFVDHNDTFTAYEDIHLMKTCSHHIIANSSFSWWGAWLNPSDTKTVIAPRYWMGSTDSYYPDLFPINWVLVDHIADGTQYTHLQAAS